MKSRIAVFGVTGLVLAVTWGLVWRIQTAADAARPLPVEVAQLAPSKPATETEPTPIVEEETPQPPAKRKPVDFDLTLPELRLPPHPVDNRPYTERDKTAAELMGSVSQSSDEDKLKTALYCLEQYADTQSAYSARKTIYEMLRKLRGEAAANAFADQEEAKGHSAGRDIPGDLLRMAEASLETNPAESKRIFDQILKDHSNSYAACHTYLHMARRCQKEGDTRAEVEWLKRAIEYEWKVNYLMWHDDTRPEAMARLASIYQEAGVWENALAILREWQPRDLFCGNAYAAADHWKAEQTMYCLCQLGRYEEALKVGWPMSHQSILHPCDSIAWMVYTLYRDAGQLGDLNAMIDDLERRTLAGMKAHKIFKARPIEDLRGYLPAGELREINAAGEMPKGLIKKTLLYGAGGNYLRNEMALYQAMSTPAGLKAKRKEAEAKAPFDFPPPPKGSLPKSIPLPATGK